MALYLGDKSASLYYANGQVSAPGVYLAGLQVFPTGPAAPMATLVTVQDAGTFVIGATSTTGFYKALWWDGTSSLHFFGYPPTKTMSVAGQKTLRLFACDVNGEPSGSLTELLCAGLFLVSLDVTALTGLVTLECESNQLASLDVSGLTALTRLNCSGNSLTSLRAVGVAPAGYYGTSFGQYIGGFDLRNNSLSASALNQFYTDLANGSGILVVGGNTGTASDDPTIATAKGYTVYGS